VDFHTAHTSQAFESTPSSKLPTGAWNALVSPPKVTQQAWVSEARQKEAAEEEEKAANLGSKLT
jgi:hypothetical protein